MDVDLLSLFNEMDDSKRLRDCVRAPFGYPGGKSKSLDKILPYLPQTKIYIEPFGGSGAVLLAREPSDLEVFNDRYSGVVSFYRCLRHKQKCEKLIERLELTVHAREEFYWCKDTWEDCRDDVERAARWYYMIQTSVGNKSDCWGRSLNSKSQLGLKIRNHIKDFLKIHERIKAVQFENLDWSDCILQYDGPNTVYYMDPPYLLSTNPYQIGIFNAQNHLELLETIQELKGFVAISGYEHPLYAQYTWDNKIQWTVQVSLDTLNMDIREDGKQSKAIETLWIRETKHG